MTTDNIIHVPDTIDGVRSLMRARKWEKAAIVWAYVEPQQGSRSDTSTKSSRSKYTIDDFVALGISGLRSKDTVRLYWRRWQDAIDSGKASAVGPGDMFVEPDEEWKRTGNGRGITDDIAPKSDDETRAKAAVRALREVDPDVRESAIAELTTPDSDPDDVDDTGDGMVGEHHIDEFKPVRTFKWWSEMSTVENALSHLLKGLDPTDDSTKVVLPPLAGLDGVRVDLAKVREMLEQIETAIAVTHG